jgi:hypothetical protein
MSFKPLWPPDLEEARQAAHRLAGAVHERQRLEQPDVLAGDRCLGDHRIEA